MGTSTGAVHNEIFLKTETCPNMLCGLQMACSADVATNVKPSFTLYSKAEMSEGLKIRPFFFFFSYEQNTFLHEFNSWVQLKWFWLS